MDMKARLLLKLMEDAQSYKLRCALEDVVRCADVDSDDVLFDLVAAHFVPAMEDDDVDG